MEIVSELPYLLSLLSETYRLQNRPLGSDRMIENTLRHTLTVFPKCLGKDPQETCRRFLHGMADLSRRLLQGLHQTLRLCWSRSHSNQLLLEFILLKIYIFFLQGRSWGIKTRGGLRYLKNGGGRWGHVSLRKAMSGIRGECDRGEDEGRCREGAS